MTKGTIIKEVKDVDIAVVGDLGMETSKSARIEISPAPDSYESALKEKISAASFTAENIGAGRFTVILLASIGIVSTIIAFSAAVIPAAVVVATSCSLAAVAVGVFMGTKRGYRQTQQDERSARENLLEYTHNKSMARLRIETALLESTPSAKDVFAAHASPNATVPTTAPPAVVETAPAPPSGAHP
jgi:hypothetical protein